jgi:hypothetical protein
VSSGKVEMHDQLEEAIYGIFSTIEGLVLYIVDKNSKGYHP